MRRRAGRFAAAAVAAAAAVGLPAGARAEAPFASLDLATAEGAAAVGATWRVHDADLVAVDFFAAGADGQPGTVPARTWDVEPRAGWKGFDDKDWPVVAPEELSARRGGGKVSFVWYRLDLVVPETVGGRPVAGATAVLETLVDDAAEVWVDGELRRCPGQSGGTMVAGWNAPNRVVLGRNLLPGRRIEVAIFGANGPLSGSPTNYVWMKGARLELSEDDGETGPRAVDPACEENLAIDRLDPRLDAIFSRNPKLFLVAEGFSFTEGPVWSPANGGELFFSEPNANRIWRWSAARGLDLFRERSGYDGPDVARFRQPGSNGLALDAQGRLTIDQHGNRRVVRLERDGRETVLAARYDGRRLNSPNDLAYSADGALYFTDPDFGLPELGRDPAKEIPYQGVYRARNDRVELLTRELRGPNGLAFSPDERFLYVGDWDDAHKAVVRYPVLADGRLGAGETFLDLTGEPGEEAIDGVETDAAGNVYVSGPGGLWIVAPDGARLGRVRTPRHAHNLAWGEDGSVLYLAARDHVYRLPTRARGHAPHLAPPPRLVRLDPRFDLLVPPDARPELVAQGHHWLEGPAWERSTGTLYYSDIPANAIFAVRPGTAPELRLRPSGYSGGARFAGREPGSNGLVFDPAGRLVICQHGDRRVVRLELDGTLTVLADRFEGRRLNSPNDAIALAGGEIWFTDPPFGLPSDFDDPAKELPFQGVYRIRPDGRIELLTAEVRAPNGLALSPDGRTLYVSNAEPGVNAVVYAFDVLEGGQLGPRRVFVDLTPESKAGRPGAPDGLEVDAAGNVWLAGPGGIHLISPAGERLGEIALDRPAANLELASDGYLYVAADTAIWRLPVAAAGGRS